MSAHKKQKVAKGADAEKVSGGMSISESFTNHLEALVAEFLTWSKLRYGLADTALARLTWMFTYNCNGGKFYRASIVLNTVKTLCAQAGREFETYENSASVLGWCIEILQACFLVADDIMDQSITRRGQPCWYKQPTVNMDAVNDAFLLRSFMHFLLKKHFQNNQGKYMRIMDLFNEASLDTEMGQMLDLTTQPQGKIGKGVLDGFSLDLYRKIVTYKTACYTFYLPVACGLIIMDHEDKDLEAARNICMKIGEKFQIQDDYLDNFGAPEMIGKIGTDILDHKCSWLCVQALTLMSPEQRHIFDENYGKHDAECEKKIKKIYDDLELKELYLKQEETSYTEISSMIEQAKSMLPSELFLPILDKIHLRQK